MRTGRSLHSAAPSLSTWRERPWLCLTHATLLQATTCCPAALLKTSWNRFEQAIVSTKNRSPGNYTGQQQKHEGPFHYLIKEKQRGEMEQSRSFQGPRGNFQHNPREVLALGYFGRWVKGPTSETFLMQLTINNINITNTICLLTFAIKHIYYWIVISKSQVLYLKN